ncbi:unnamed protein product [Rhizophagus irregularis]|nr:unnamed protein product [Rhizophagus irregularis]
MLFNSDVSLCELMSEIYKLLDEQDKKNIYQYWKLAIPSRFLTPAILKLQHDEINQSLYYAANPIDEQDIVVINEVSYDDECAESPWATIEQLIEVSGRDNVKEIWAVRVGNSLIAKHYVILLKNDAHMCSCLMVIRKGVVCRHYFQVMLNTCEARFHIRLIPSRWYQKDKDASHEAFIVADKFQNGMSTNAIQENNVEYLCAIDKEKEDLLEHRMNLLDEKIMYGTLHGTYKKALRKALQTKTDSLRLIEILEDFANEDSEFESEDERLGEEEFDESDKENINPFQLGNPKIRCGKGRPAGTRRYKASNEKDQSEKTKQRRRCKKCGNLGHYQKNCNA